MNVNTRIALAAATALTLTGVLVGCSSNDTSTRSGMSHSGMAGMSSSPSASSPVSAKHNTPDVTFAQAMIAHHQGAIQMAQLAAQKATRPEVRQLAGRIEQEQSPEIEQMTGWLSSWHEPTSMSESGSGSMPMPTDSSMPGMDMGDPTASAMSAMPGMSPEDLKSLADATGTDVDKTFLTLMIEHHQGATRMAQDEIADGQNPQALRLARSIVHDQTAEIQEMQSLLQGMS